MGGSLKKGENPRVVREGHQERSHEEFWFHRDTLASLFGISKSCLMENEARGKIDVSSLLSICRFYYDHTKIRKTKARHTERPIERLGYTRADLAKLFGMKEATLRKNEERLKVDAGSLESICEFWYERLNKGAQR